MPSRRADLAVRLSIARALLRDIFVSPETRDYPGTGNEAIAIDYEVEAGAYTRQMLCST